MSVRTLMAVFVLPVVLAGCSIHAPRITSEGPFFGDMPTFGSLNNGDTAVVEDVSFKDDSAQVTDQIEWGEAEVIDADANWPQAVADSDGRYLLDSGDRLRIFVYGQPNLSRIYIVDHDGKIVVPLIGQVNARGLTTHALQQVIRRRLAADYVRDPQVTVDIRQNRPFFILGEVKNAGQYPFVSGMTVQTAIAIAGGYTERASKRSYEVTRRINGVVNKLDVDGDYAVKPGDTVLVYERFL